MGFYTSMITENTKEMDERNKELEKPYDKLDKACVEKELDDALESIEDMHEGFEFRVEAVPVYQHESAEMNLLSDSYFVEYAELIKYMNSADIDSVKEALENIAEVNTNEEVEITAESISVVINPAEITDVLEAVDFIQEAKEEGVGLFKSKFDMFNGKKIDRNIAKLEKKIEKETDPDKLKQLKADLKDVKAAKAKFEANKK